MNERIKELAEQAGFIKFKTYDNYEYLKTPTIPVESWCLDTELGKFAELIVRECMEIVGSADMTELEGPDPEDVLYVACKQVKEHFGVE